MHILNGIKSQFVRSLILYKTATIFKSIVGLQRYRHCWASRVYWKSDKYYVLFDTEKIPAMKAGDCHTCYTSKSILYMTSCNVCLIKHAKFPIFFGPLFLLFVLQPFLNKFRIRTCSICWSRDPKKKFQYGLLFIRRGDPIAGYVSTFEGLPKSP